ncbi:MAG TPA: TraR/DksA C4-type zinc finger protein [Acidiferrobacterales bacterium]|nr:TraR/DksA C4-type zinc finger protein [Acidiferrobacterales bacterium]
MSDTSDVVDSACKLEQRENADALAAHMARVSALREPAPQIENGVRVCIDCGDDLDEQRLAAQPDAARCVPCKTRAERRRP